MQRRFITIVMTASLLTTSSGVDVDASPGELRRLLDLHHEVIQSAMTGDTSGLQKARTIFDWIQNFEKDVLISHPINVFKLYKMWAESASALSDLAREFPGEKVQEMLMSLPDRKMVKEMAVTILRLQAVYNISISDLIAGSVLGRSAVKPMDKSECFLVADAAYECLMEREFEDWHEHCIEHFVSYDLEASARRESSSTRRQELSRKKEELNSSSEMTQKLQRELPMDIMAKVQEMKSQTSANDDSNKQSEKFFDTYRRLCSSVEPSTSILPPAEKCIWHKGSTSSDILKLAPLKVEFLAYDPLVAIVHEALDHKTARKLRHQASLVGLRTPLSIASTSGRVQQSAARTGKMTFLPDLDDPRLERLCVAISGLSAEHAEPLQVVNYGVGGHYEPHVDYFSVGGENVSKTYTENGDRLATLLFYLNDVEFGGATVFPALGLGVRPEKGSALFWYNLYRNGDGDSFTLHSGCPVVLGQKWIANKWFRARGQEHSRPCALERDS